MNTASRTLALNVNAAHEARTERQLGMLQRLAELAMAMAEAIGEEALAARPIPGQTPGDGEGGPRRSPADLAAVFTGVSRAVRQTIALEARLMSDGVGREARAGQVELERRREDARAALRRRRIEVRDIVQAVIEAESDDCIHSSLRRTLDARLERETDDSDILDLPLGEAVARICRDLGLSPDWLGWDADWATEALDAEDRRPRRPAGDPLRARARPTSAWPAGARPSGIRPHARPEPRGGGRKDPGPS